MYWYYLNVKKKILIYTSFILLILLNLYFGYINYNSYNNLKKFNPTVKFVLETLDKMSNDYTKSEELYGKVTNVLKMDDTIELDLSFKGDNNKSEKVVLHKDDFVTGLYKVTEKLDLSSLDEQAIQDMGEIYFTLTFSSSEIVSFDQFSNEISKEDLVYLALIQSDTSIDNEYEISRFIYAK